MGQQGKRPRAKNREVERILREAEDQGFQVRQLASGHFAVSQPTGEWITNFPNTPGNDARRSILNSLAPLKRAGYRSRR